MSEAYENIELPLRDIVEELKTLNKNMESNNVTLKELRDLYFDTNLNPFYGKRANKHRLKRYSSDRIKQ